MELPPRLHEAAAEKKHSVRTAGWTPVAFTGAFQWVFGRRCSRCQRRSRARTSAGPTAYDRVALLLNLLPVALAAGVRAVLWLVGINMAGLPFCSAAQHVCWTASPLPIEDDCDSCGAPDIPRHVSPICLELIERRAQCFPHAGARAFSDHIAGVANILGAWEQPPDLCLAGLLHSVYSTEMYPWRLFKTSERQRLQAMAGSRVEHLVFLYCTCSQQGLYKEVARLSAASQDLSAGLQVRNFYTGERTVLSSRQAARLLLILAADLMEQDRFFSLHLPLACLRLAGPHLSRAPTLYLKLEKAGVFALDSKQLDALASSAKMLLLRASRIAELQDVATQAALLAALRDAAQRAPWLYELSVETARLAKTRVSRDTYAWCKAWGTRWSCVGSPVAALNYTAQGRLNAQEHSTAKYCRMQLGGEPPMSPGAADANEHELLASSGTLTASSIRTSSLQTAASRTRAKSPGRNRPLRASPIYRSK